MKKQKKKKNNRIHRAVTHIKLELANAGKSDRLDEVGEAFISLTQSYVDYIFDNHMKDISKYDTLPDINTNLSERYKRCAWQQAVGIMLSFFANKRENKPVLKKSVIQGNPNVIRIENSKTKTFDFWLVVSTLEKGKPIRVPVKIHDYGKKVLETGKLCSGISLNLENGKWYATLVVETRNSKEKASGNIIGVDLGIKNLLTTPAGHFGQFSEKLVSLVRKDEATRRRKQKLNGCRKKKNQEPVSLGNKKLQATIRNEIGRAINEFMKSIPADSVVVLEKLSIQGMRFKSRVMNRILKASSIGYAFDRLKEKLDLSHIRYTSVSAAYSSQQCSKCGYVDRKNRPSQEKFKCKFCEYTVNADVNASFNLAKRFGDEKLNGLTDYRKVKPFLLKRFFERFPGARSASDKLEPGFTLREIDGFCH